MDIDCVIDDITILKKDLIFFAILDGLFRWQPGTIKQIICHDILKD